MIENRDYSLTVNVQPFVDGIITADKNQFQGLVKERNEYKILLDQCLYALNVIPNTPLSDGVSTYALASTISAAFKKFDCR